MAKLIDWILTRLLRRERFEIGRKGVPDYLTRWTIWGSRYGQPGRSRLFLHHFHRGDQEDYFHDHPWAFWSLILWGGYCEHTPAGRRWYGPMALLRRPAEWRHRVELPPRRKAWTLVWTGPRVRGWGFWCPFAGFRPWREHQASQDRGGSGCD